METCVFELHTSIFPENVFIVGFGNDIIWISGLWVFLLQKPPDSVAVAMVAH